MGWVINATPRPLYALKEIRSPLYSRPDRPQGRSGRVRKNIACTGIRSPARSARSESLYRLSYPSPHASYFISISSLSLRLPVSSALVFQFPFFPHTTFCLVTGTTGAGTTRVWNDLRLQAEMRYSELRLLDMGPAIHYH